MSLSLHESRRRSRRQRRARVTKWLVIVAMLGGLGYGAYASGTALAEHEVQRLQKDKEELARRIATLEEENDRRQAAAAGASLREQQWRQRYEHDVPAGPSKGLLGLLNERLNDGVRPERLALAIGAAVNKPDCENKPVTKRFIVRTPLHPGGNDTVSFADNAITVTAEGRSSVENGNPRSVFDPAQPVTAAFTLLGGKKSEASGVLPLHHSVVAGGSEYRFSVVAAEARGLVHVTADRCRMPDQGQ